MKKCDWHAQLRRYDINIKCYLKGKNFAVSYLSPEPE